MASTSGCFDVFLEESKEGEKNWKKIVKINVRHVAFVSEM